MEHRIAFPFFWSIGQYADISNTEYLAVHTHSLQYVDKNETNTDMQVNNA